ncbi:fused response regulator/phosphatase [Teredinibacter sp. KSP-S5-2]|uniref:ATP-binding SpoIIE family protein phosphatase n=1 Tax=Teredinibacter sp. KSP-S5-2 TaxID=3034506 RepID=UPI00293497DC|nr:fused response regulator/phosphatase [Teredinibacter sp. KSP-S5-2]WNO07994.1 fused response regulator/phosphatase [Teredinibacter sp. KSP-S5-2]
MKILIVDDHGYNRELLALILEDEHHECCFATNGIEACDLVAADESIDLILMDINMPEMDGITATQKIKAGFGERLTPVIFVTALDDADVVSQCLEAGGDDFVPKPVNENILIAKVNAHGRSLALYNNLKKAHAELTFHKQLMDREHLVVEQVFNSANRTTTYCDNIQKYTSPASMFNGDLVLVSPSPSGGVYILVGDFTGHGLAASIGSLPVSEIFFSQVARHVSVGQIVIEINSRLNKLLPSNMFFCATLIHMDYLGKSLTVWSGGMNDMLCVSPEGRLQKIESAHMPLGLLCEEEFDEEVRILEFTEQNRIYLYTDGVNEAQNADGEEFGLQRLEDMVIAGSGNMVDRIRDAVQVFCGETEQNDDISIVEILTGPVTHRNKETQELVDVTKDYYNASSFPWDFSMNVENQDLKNPEIMHQVLDLVSCIRGIEIHQDKFFTIVSELFSNALEHGVLGLDSGLKESADGFERYYQLREQKLNSITNAYIKMDIAYLRGEPNQIRLVITDSGNGFDFQRYLNQQEANDNAHGRGLALLQNLCSFIEYSDGGRTVTAIYSLSQDNCQ